MVLNAGVVCLVFLVTERIFGDRSLGLLSAALFALHPIHSESVNWIAAVTDLQLAFFYLLTFWVFLRVGEKGGDDLRSAREGIEGLGSSGGHDPEFCPGAAGQRTGRHSASSRYLLRTLSAPRPRPNQPEAEDQPLFDLWLTDLAYLLFRIRILGGLAPVVQLPRVSRREAFYSSFALIAQYAGKLVWPVHLCGFYTFHKSVGLADLACSPVFSSWEELRRRLFTPGEESACSALPFCGFS